MSLGRDPSGLDAFSARASPQCQRSHFGSAYRPTFQFSRTAEMSLGQDPLLAVRILCLIDPAHRYTKPPKVDLNQRDENGHLVFD